ncbi:bifunctional DNA-formamidopyrimidine glycosylase/DNA-(apurinic or apyrimidinic site) lyase [Amnibacterium sp.]|uniref:bifunctional DNA-formamidopyrimidine glycosylase/DNA-(apurinic or apyrimidinic site) lyase n=1 Tax=Amnibacterium sp. TaxID=1872496 RepID=UPI003F7B4C62
MPELPEVEVVRSGLEPAVRGAVVAAVEVLEPRSLRRHEAGAADFEARLTGRRLTGAVRRGKYLWLPVEPRSHEAPFAVLAHLGMSGQILLRTPEAPPDRQLRVRLALDHPGWGDLVVAFADQRIFGSLSLDPLEPTPDGQPGGHGDPAPLVPLHVAHIARDPLDPAFDDDGFVARLRGRRTELKRALLDQTLVSGVGNIYADESLWAARLHPARSTAGLPVRAARRLLAEVRSVLERALVDGGTSFDAQYVNVNGASGYFSQRLNAYGREGKPCPRCGRPIVREAFMNRSSHLCRHCQRLPPSSATA